MKNLSQYYAVNSKYFAYTLSWLGFPYKIRKTGDKTCVYLFKQTQQFTESFSRIQALKSDLQKEHLIQKYET